MCELQMREHTSSKGTHCSVSLTLCKHIIQIYIFFSGRENINLKYVYTHHSRALHFFIWKINLLNPNVRASSGISIGHEWQF